MEGGLSARLEEEYSDSGVSPMLAEDLDRFLSSGAEAWSGVSGYAVVSRGQHSDIKRLLKKGHHAYLADPEKFGPHLQTLLSISFDALENIEAKAVDGLMPKSYHKLETHLCGDLGSIAQDLHKETGDQEYGETSYEAWDDAAWMTPSDKDYSRLAHQRAADAAERMYQQTGIPVWSERRCMHLLKKADITDGNMYGGSGLVYSAVADIADRHFEATGSQFWAEVFYESVKSAVRSIFKTHPKTLAEFNCRLSEAACKLLSLSSDKDAIEDWFDGMYKSALHCESFDRDLAARRYAYAGRIAMKNCEGYDKETQNGAVLYWLDKGYNSHLRALQLFEEGAVEKDELMQRYELADACARIGDVVSDKRSKAKWRARGWKHVVVVKRFCEKNGCPEHVSSGKLENLLFKLVHYDKKSKAKPKKHSKK